MEEELIHLEFKKLSLNSIQLNKGRMNSFEIQDVFS